MFLPGITVRFAKWRWNHWARSGVANVDRSKVAFLRTFELASTTGRFPLLVVHSGCCRWLVVGRRSFCWSRTSLIPPFSFLSYQWRMLWPVLVLEPWIFRVALRYCMRMKKTEVEDGRVQVLHEDEEEWSRRQRGWGLQWFEHRSTFLVYGKTSSLWTNKI